MQHTPNVSCPATLTIDDYFDVDLKQQSYLTSIFCMNGRSNIVSNALAETVIIYFIVYGVPKRTTVEGENRTKKK